MRSILLLDDGAIPAAAVALILRRHQFGVRIAHTVTAALVLIRQTHFDLVLAEFDLRPDRGRHPRTGTGLNLVRQLRAAHLTTPVYVFSAMEGKFYETASFDAGANGFIPKTTPICVLVAQICNRIQGPQSA